MSTNSILAEGLGTVPCLLRYNIKKAFTSAPGYDPVATVAKWFKKLHLGAEDIAEVDATTVWRLCRLWEELCSDSNDAYNEVDPHAQISLDDLAYASVRFCREQGYFEEVFLIHIIPKRFVSL